MKQWLQNFAFAMEINWITFLMVAIVALVITFTTVSFHTLKAANANPVDALKEE
jgi:putative ABC transport system permease protein